VNSALDLSRELIARKSVTPADAGCQVLLVSRLAKAGFQCEDASVNGVTNLWARRGNGHPLLCFAGHTDVVPTGPQRIGSQEKPAAPRREASSSWQPASCGVMERREMSSRASSRVPCNFRS